MSGNVAYLDMTARRKRRDDLIEEAIALLTDAKQVVEGDGELVVAIQAIEGVKKMRRAEVVDRLSAEILARTPR